MVMEEPSFEEALRQLEGVVSKLEGGNLLLEEALKAFEEGVRLARICSQRLEEGERKVSLLLRSPGGEWEQRPFEPTGTDEGD